MKRCVLRAAWALFGVVLFWCASCTPTQVRDFQASPPGKVLDCSSAVVQKCGPQSLPAVNRCLADEREAVQCILGLIGPSTCAAEQVIACVTRHSGATAAASVERNADDVLSLRMADNARRVIKERGWTFAR